MLPPQTHSEFRAPSPTMTKQISNQTNGSFQIKFNYQPNQHISSPQVVSSIPRSIELKQAPRPIPIPINYAPSS